MPAALDHVTADTPMGANLVAGGATFRVWAPNARAVHICGEFNGFQPDDANLLTRDAHGHWRGFVPRVRDRHRYRFWVVGAGGTGFKRDPYARELATPFPSDCIVREPDFPWHETGYWTPPFADFVIYQLHVGAFFAPNLPRRTGTFLDVARKIPHFARSASPPSSSSRSRSSRPPSARATTAPTTSRRRWTSRSRTWTSPRTWPR